VGEERGRWAAVDCMTWHYLLPFAERLVWASAPAFGDDQQHTSLHSVQHPASASNIYTTPPLIDPSHHGAAAHQHDVRPVSGRTRTSLPLGQTTPFLLVDKQRSEWQPSPSSAQEIHEPGPRPTSKHRYRLVCVPFPLSASIWRVGSRTAAQARGGERADVNPPSRGRELRCEQVVPPFIGITRW
jgi:hypothetical protein